MQAPNQQTSSPSLTSLWPSGLFSQTWPTLHRGALHGPTGVCRMGWCMGSCADSGDLEVAALYESLCSQWQAFGGSPELLLLMRQDAITQGTGRDHTSVQSSGFYRAEINDNLLCCEAACSIQTQQQLGAAPVRSHPDKSVHQDWLEGRILRFLSEPRDLYQSVVAEKQVLGLLLKGKKLGKIIWLLGQSKSFRKSHM